MSQESPKRDKPGLGWRIFQWLGPRIITPVHVRLFRLLGGRLIGEGWSRRKRKDENGCVNCCVFVQDPVKFTWLSA